MNKVQLIGRLTKSPELRMNEGGKSIVSFSIAVNRSYKNANGNYDADFMNCQAFNQRAEIINKYFTKGDRIGIAGRIMTGSYEAQDGTKRYTTNVIVEDIEFLQDKHATGNPVEDVETTKQEDDPFADFGSEVTITDEDLPF